LLETQTQAMVFRENARFVLGESFYAFSQVRTTILIGSAEDFTYFPKLGRKTEFEHGIEMDSKKSDINSSGR